MNLILIIVFIGCILDCVSENILYLKIIKAIIAFVAFIPVYFSMNILCRNRNSKFKYLLQKTIKTLNKDFYIRFVNKHYHHYLTYDKMSIYTSCGGELKKIYKSYNWVKNKAILLKRGQKFYNIESNFDYSSDEFVILFEDRYLTNVTFRLIRCNNKNVYCFTKINENYDGKIKNKNEFDFNYIIKTEEKEETELIKYFQEDQYLLVKKSSKYKDGIVHKMNYNEKIYIWNTKKDKNKYPLLDGDEDDILQKWYEIIMDILFNPLAIVYKIGLLKDSGCEGGYYWVENNLTIEDILCSNF